MSKYPHCKATDRYARGVSTGKIPANQWIKLAIQRYLDDMEAAKGGGSPYYFDPEAAQHACDFIELMPHTKGKWARDGKTLGLQDWQAFFVCNIFGWKRRDNDARRFTEADLWVPRKNGKSQLAAAIGNYMLVADGEYAPEVYSGATTEKQALEVFVPAKMMALKCEEFIDAFGVEVNAKNLSVPDTGAKFEPIIGNPGDGSSPHCAIVDEYHEHPDDRQFDTMVTGMGAREQPLLLMITTAGDDLSGPCYSLQQDCQRMLKGAKGMDHVFAMIYGVDPEDDWTSIAALKKANPNYGVSVSKEYLKQQLARARNVPRKQSAYKTKHLNIWVGSKDAFYNVMKWESLGDETLKLEDFKGERVYLGLDLASRVDIAALEVLIPLDDETFIQFGKHYLPEQALEIEHYEGWHAEGKLIITDGEIIDFEEIKEDILELCSFFEVAELAYDPFQATKLVTELMDEGVPVVEMRPTVLNFSEPMKELDAIIRDQRIRHNGDPVFTWMLGNVTGKLDKKDNVYPNKEKPENKIDGPVALIMALGRAMQGEDNSLNLAINDPIKARA